MYKSAVVATVAIGAAVAFPVAASAAPASLVIHVVEHTYTFNEQGNAFSFQSHLTQNGKTVGSDAVTCYLGGKCFAVFEFKGEGDLFAQVPTKATNNKIFYPTVIGGTETFTNAHGYIKIVSGNSTSDLTFHIHT